MKSHLFRSFAHFNLSEKSKYRKTRLGAKSVKRIELPTSKTNKVLEKDYEVMSDLLLIKTKLVEIESSNEYSLCVQGWFDIDTSLFNYKFTLFRETSSILEHSCTSIDAWNVLDLTNKFGVFKPELQEEANQYKKCVSMRVRGDVIYWYRDEMDYQEMNDIHKNYDWSQDSDYFCRSMFAKKVCSKNYQELGELVFNLVGFMNSTLVFDKSFLEYKLKFLKIKLSKDCSPEETEEIRNQVKFQINLKLGYQSWYAANVLKPAYDQYLLAQSTESEPDLKTKEDIHNVISAYSNFTEFLGTQSVDSSINSILAGLRNEKWSIYLDLHRYTDSINKIISSFESVQAIFSQLKITMPVISELDEKADPNSNYYATKEYKKDRVKWWENMHQGYSLMRNFSGKIINKENQNSEYFIDRNYTEDILTDQDLFKDCLYYKNINEEYSLMLKQTHSNMISVNKMCLIRRFKEETDGKWSMKVVYFQEIESFVRTEKFFFNRNDESIICSLQLNNNEKSMVDGIAFYKFCLREVIKEYEEMRSVEGINSEEVLIGVKNSLFHEVCQYKIATEPKYEVFFGFDFTFDVAEDKITIFTSNRYIEDTMKTEYLEIHVIDLNKERTHGSARFTKSGDGLKSMIEPIDSEHTIICSNGDQIELSHEFTWPRTVNTLKNLALYFHEDLFDHPHGEKRGWRQRLTLYEIKRKDIAVIDRYNFPFDIEMGIPEQLKCLVFTAKNNLYTLWISESDLRYKIVSVHNKRLLTTNNIRRLSIGLENEITRAFKCRSLYVGCGQSDFEMVMSSPDVHDYELHIVNLSIVF